MLTPLALAGFLLFLLAGGLPLASAVRTVANASSNVRVIPFFRRSTRTSLLCTPNTICPSILAGVHLAQQSVSNSLFLARSRSSQSQSSTDWFSRCVLEANLCRHTWQFRPAFHRFLSVLMISLLSSSCVSVRPIERTAWRVVVDKHESNLYCFVFCSLCLEQRRIDS